MKSHLGTAPTCGRTKVRGGLALLSSTLSFSLPALLPSALALAQPAGREGRPPRPPVDVVLDANDDGVIDQREIAGAGTALRKLDANKDGRLTRDELRPARPGESTGRGPGAPPPDGAAGPPEGGRPKKPHPPIVTTLDVNGDGLIDAKELAAAPASLKKLDGDGDGKLSPNEYRPPRPDDGAPSAKTAPGRPQ